MVEGGGDHGGEVDQRLSVHPVVGGDEHGRQEGQVAEGEQERPGRSQRGRCGRARVVARHATVAVEARAGRQPLR